VQYFAARVRSADPSWAAIFGYLHRRYGIEAVDANGRALHVPADDERRPEMGAIYRRLWNADATARIEQIAALASSIDRMSASALHCDRIPLPANWETVLRHASSVGGYALTHAVVAAQRTIDNGCHSAADLEGLQAAQVVFLERLAGTRDDLLASQEAGNDRRMEPGPSRGWLRPASDGACDLGAVGAAAAGSSAGALDRSAWPACAGRSSRMRRGGWGILRSAPNRPCDRGRHRSSLRRCGDPQWREPRDRGRA
jgi:hypothetical protein